MKNKTLPQLENVKLFDFIINENHLGLKSQGLKLGVEIRPQKECPDSHMYQYIVTPGFNPRLFNPTSLRLKSSWSKSLGLKIGVENSRVDNSGFEMSCNHITRLSQLEDGKPVWVPAQTGRALLDEFLIQCSEWADPNDHAVNKFIFKLVSQKERGEETTSK